MHGLVALSVSRELSGRPGCFSTCDGAAALLDIVSSMCVSFYAGFLCAACQLRRWTRRRNREQFGREHEIRVRRHAPAREDLSSRSGCRCDVRNDFDRLRQLNCFHPLGMLPWKLEVALFSLLRCPFALLPSTTTVARPARQTLGTSYPTSQLASSIDRVRRVQVRPEREQRHSCCDLRFAIGVCVVEIRA